MRRRAHLILLALAAVALALAALAVALAGLTLAALALAALVLTRRGRGSVRREQSTDRRSHRGRLLRAVQRKGRGGLGEGRGQRGGKSEEGRHSPGLWVDSRHGQQS